VSADGEGLAGAGTNGPTSTKKRMLGASSPAPVADDVSWTICCMDGATFPVAVPEDAPVAALKLGIGEVRAELGQLQLGLLYLCLSSNQLTGQGAFREYMQEHNPVCELDLHYN
jgi:hypothetical protein